MEDQRPGQGPGLRAGGRLRGREAARLRQERGRLGLLAVQQDDRPGEQGVRLAINQVSYTPQRAKALGFSAGYYFVNSRSSAKGKPIASVRSIAGLRRYKLGRYSDDELPVHRPQHQAEPVGRGLRHERRRGRGAEERPDRRSRRRPADRVLRHRRAGPNGKIIGQFQAASGRRSASDGVPEGQPADRVRQQRPRADEAHRRAKRIQQDLAQPRSPAPPFSNDAVPGRLGRTPKILGVARRRTRRQPRARSRRSSSLQLRLAASRTHRTGPGQGRVLRRDAYRRSFPAIAAAFLLNVKIFCIAEAIILVTALVLAVLRGLPGPVFFPVRARDRLRRLLPRRADDPRHRAARLRRTGARDRVGIPTSTTFWGIVSLVLVYTAYVSEVYRAGIESVHPSQEAPRVARADAGRRSLRRAAAGRARVIPPLLNDFIGLQKDTALVGIFGSVEAFKQAQIEVSADSTSPITSSPRRSSSITSRSRASPTGLSARTGASGRPGGLVRAIEIRGTCGRRFGKNEVLRGSTPTSPSTRSSA